MRDITDGAETFLRLLEQSFACEIANHDIGSPHVNYPSGPEARMAMLRQAYLRGAHDERRNLFTFIKHELERSVTVDGEFAKKALNMCAQLALRVAGPRSFEEAVEQVENANARNRRKS